MARVTSSSSSSTVGITDTSGNVLNSTGGSLDVEITGGTVTAVINEGFSNLAPGYPTQATVGTSSVQLFPANSLRKYGHIFNNSSQAIFIQYSSSAALNQGIKINPGTFFTLDSNNLWLGVINAIGYIPGQLIDILEGE